MVTFPVTCFRLLRPVRIGMLVLEMLRSPMMSVTEPRVVRSCADVIVRLPTYVPLCPVVPPDVPVHTGPVHCVHPRLQQLPSRPDQPPAAWSWAARAAT